MCRIKRIYVYHGDSEKIRDGYVASGGDADRTANTSAATVPTALDEAVRDGRIQRGQLLLLEAFGGGWTWGSALVRF